MARTQGSHSKVTGPRLRAAALRLFARHGYAAVSMRQIAAEVGVQAGALYNYIPDKQGLLFGLMRDHMIELIGDYRARRLPDSALARLKDFTRFHIAHNLERPDEIFIAYMELRNLSPENFAEIETLRREYETVLEGILRQGMDESTMRLADPRITSLALIAMLNGVNTWYRRDGRLSVEDIAALYWDMVRKTVGA